VGERRVLILGPGPRDAKLAQEVLERAGIVSVVSPDMSALLDEAAVGAGALLVSEEALMGPTRRALAEFLDQQPPWSDLPLLILTRTGADSPLATRAAETLGNVSLLERPVRVAALVSAVQTALRARARQYELRDRFESQSLLASIVDSSDDAIVSMTLDGTILTWNRSAERMFGYTADQVVGKSILLIVPPYLHDEAREILDRIARGERSQHFETHRLTRDGRLLDISLSVSPVRDASGQVVGASKVARDISAQKRAEQALREADRRKDEFLATLAHELRNPLAPIRNALHILRLTDNSHGTLERVREMMERQVNHMVRLVDDLMEVSRITRGKIELRFELLDLAEVIQSALETSQPLIESSGHRLRLSLPDEPVILNADPVRLAQVVANLLNNAAKYAPDPGDIWVTVEREGPMVSISVRDSGIGISPEMLPRVFDLFTQLDVAHGRSQGGLGIGLTLVQRLARMHGGDVEARSEGPGKGSEFIVRLPVASVGAPDAIRRRASRPAAVTQRVLVVDDNQDAADSLGLVLSHLGAIVHVVHDGPSALQVLPVFRPSLVLLDIGMPGMNGYEVAAAIRQLPGGQHLRLVALTGWGQEEDRRLSAAAGFDHHLIKPTDIDTLQDLLASAPRNRAPGPVEGETASSPS
jgi:PAS domain S-box-containing protein